VSSPNWGNQQSFLAVPNARSRGASIDSEVETAIGSDFTHVNVQKFGDDLPASKFNDLNTGPHHNEPAILPDEEALKPDPGTEKDFVRENNPFAFTPGELGKLFNPKSLGAFHALGGLSGIEKGLRSDRNAGLSIDEQHLEGQVTFEDATGSSPFVKSSEFGVSAPSASSPAAIKSFNDRIRIFQDNRLPEKKAKSIFQLMWLAYNDKVLIVLTVAAVVALAVGLYQALSEGGVEWIEGVAIIIAIIVVVLVGAINDWQKELQFAKLNKKKADRNVNVVRSGNTEELNVYDLVVGDVLLIASGDVLPVDGILISGHGVKCDESSATGESDLLKKTPGDEVFAAMEKNGNLRKMDPFMISGGKVTEGVGRMMVTAVGVNSSYGKTMLTLQDSNDMTPLQSKLNKLAEYIAKIGSAAAILLFVILFIKFLAGLRHDDPGMPPRTPEQKGRQFLNILIVAITIIVVAVPEGLPLAVTLALAYATRRMLKDRNLVRVLRSCETMGNATTVCSDKTGTLTQNVMTVVAGSIGTSSRFRDQVGAEDASTKNTAPVDEIDAQQTKECIATLAPSVKTLLKESIAINSTAFEKEENGKQIFIGSKTETALLDFAKEFLAMEKVQLERDNAEIVQMIPFDSSRKCMGMVIKNRETKGYRLIVKGASEIMLRQSSQIISDPTKDISGVALNTDTKATLESLINAYASRSLRTIGLLYRDFDSESWPPKGVRKVEDDPSQASFDDIFKQMIFVGVVGIQDPLRPGVKEAVKDMITAGVFPRMVTGDNIITAKAIATECGIFTAGGVALEGPEFRKMSKAEQKAIIPKLQVLARSSPDDKRTLVKRLKEMGETVAVTGDGTNDAPALKAADVGFSMNIAGTEVAKEASDIILMDDNFASIVNALMWGRAVNDAVRKFLQFQITVNITAVLLAFISAVSSANETSVLSAVQLLWVNLIMDTMAALALATDPPSRKILNRKPDPKSAPLISVTMWKMIIGQAIYQLTITLVLYFAGPTIFQYGTEEELKQHATLVFNTFVWMQIFNALNNRRLDNRFNIFEGLEKNLFFIGIFFVMVGGQVIIIFFGGWEAFQAQYQFGDQWAVAIVLGAISIPIGVVIRLVPDELAKQLVPKFLRDMLTRDKSKIVVTDEENPFEFNAALVEIKEELAWLKKYKGGRLNNLKFTLAHPKEAFLASRSPSRSRASSTIPRTPTNEAEDDKSHSPAPLTPESRRHKRGRSRSNSALAGAAMAGIIASSIGGGWSPADRQDNESLRFQRDRSKSDLSRDARIEVHPNTKKDQEIIVEGDPIEQAGGKPPSQSTKTTPDFSYGPFGGSGDTKSGDEKKREDGETR
jgi:Ca2+-transporting ATPase